MDQSPRKRFTSKNRNTSPSSANPRHSRTMADDRDSPFEPVGDVGESDIGFRSWTRDASGAVIAAGGGLSAPEARHVLPNVGAGLMPGANVGPHQFFNPFGLNGMPFVPCAPTVPGPDLGPPSAAGASACALPSVSARLTPDANAAPRNVFNQVGSSGARFVPTTSHQLFADMANPTVDCSSIPSYAPGGVVASSFQGNAAVPPASQPQPLQSPNSHNPCAGRTSAPLPPGTTRCGGFAAACQMPEAWTFAQAQAAWSETQPLFAAQGFPTTDQTHGVSSPGHEPSLGADAQSPAHNMPQRDTHASAHHAPSANRRQAHGAAAPTRQSPAEGYAQASFDHHSSQGHSETVRADSTHSQPFVDNDAILRDYRNMSAAKGSVARRNTWRPPRSLGGEQAYV